MLGNNGVSFTSGKYRAIIISIGFFLVFDLGVLILNYLISTKIVKDAVAVNLAGRQRMLSQRMVKTLLQTSDAIRTGQAPDAALKELRLTFDLFDNTLNSFNLGGQAVGGDGTPVTIERVASAPGRAAIDEALLLWRPYRAEIKKILDNATASSLVLAELLPRAIDYAKANNLILLKLMNDLTSDLENVAASKADRLRMIQTTGILLALGNFFLILFHFLRQLRIRDQAVEQAKNETDEILGTVNEGLFLIDANYQIGSQYSAQMEKLLDEDELGGKNFIEILKRHVPDNLVNMSKDYLDLLFEGRVKEKLVTSLNPLHEVRFLVDSRGSRGRQRYLDFGFNRVVERQGIKHILVTATDVTQKVLLMRELEQSEINNKIQIELLLDMLKVQPALLKEFIQSTERELYGINRIFKDQHSYGHRDKLKEIFALVHTIKGNAAAINMALFEQRMHEFEDAITEVLNRSGMIDGQDFLALAIKLESSLQLVETVRAFLNRIIEINRTFDADVPASALSAHQFEELINRISNARGKKIVVDHAQFKPELIPGDKHLMVKDILLQLLRNSVVHGIEEPELRRLVNKPESGRITIATEPAGNGIKVVVRDDGRGIDVETIRRKALESGLWQADEIARWDNNKLIALIFEDQFSTAEQVDQDAGRGMGMSAVKQLLKRINAGLGISYAPGEYCEFRITVPAT